MEVVMIPFSQLDEPPFPMRVQFGELPFNELVESIRANGVEVPLKVRPVNGRYQIIYGHRRYKAAGVCALAELPCIVEECDDYTAARRMITENFGREELSAAEEGWNYLELVERFRLNEKQLCELVKQSPTYVNERIDLVRNDAEIAQAVAERKVNFSVARELLRCNRFTAALSLKCSPDEIPAEKVEGFARHRLYLLDLCIRSGATARVARSYVEQWKQALVPINPYNVEAAQQAAAAAPTPEPEMCVVCGRDFGPYNLDHLPVHSWEKEGLLRILKEAGLNVRR